ncbi:ERF family protein [Campylobacter sp. 19-13652]|uniref:ERF family protein n=1 Tax=Campylobacter sp. 19-13652 TaxID=2840180 RepID=UPI001C793965|nr:ERF family protein [Campylobacter sp. 19-13652]BCX79233.1 hypothetical protein LBC_06950 [Campylobacter sp. 19-13652]
MHEILSKIQTELKAPKSQFNKFGNYAYRNCEDILEALKPLLAKHNVVITLTDKIVLVNERYYIKATATIRGEKGEISTTAYAREPLNKKGMDESQITGAASSYARKYALNGLFAIDDEKDADSEQEQKSSTKAAQKERLSPEQVGDLTQLIEASGTVLADFLGYFKVREIAEVPYDVARQMLLKKLQKAKNEAQTGA